MRKLAQTRFLLAILLPLASCLSPAVASAAVVHATYSFSDFTTHALSVKRVTVTPLAAGADYAGAQLSNRPLIYSVPTYYMLTNGSITISNLVCGYAYKVAFSDGYNEPAITNYFHTNITSGTVVDANDYKTATITYFNGTIVQVYYSYLVNTNYTDGLTNTIRYVMSGALTNNEVRAVALLGRLSVGGFYLSSSNTLGFVDTNVVTISTNLWEGKDRIVVTSCPTNEYNGTWYLNHTTTGSAIYTNSGATGATIELGGHPDSLASATIFDAITVAVFFSGDVLDLTGSPTNSAGWYYNDGATPVASMDSAFAGSYVVTARIPHLNGVLPDEAATKIDSTNAALVSITNIIYGGDGEPRHVNSASGLFNTRRKIALHQPPAILLFGDNAIPFGNGFTTNLINGLASFLPELNQSKIGANLLQYSTGNGNYESSGGEGVMWQGDSWALANTKGMTNTYLGYTGVAADHLLLQFWKSNHFGTLTIWTSSPPGGAWAVCRTINADNGGAFTTAVTNIYLGGLLANVTAGVVSSGSNIVGRSIGLYSTNFWRGYVLDLQTVSNGDIEKYMTNSAHSNALMAVMPYYDCFVISDQNHSNAIYRGVTHLKNAVSSRGLRTDIVLLSGSANTNSPSLTAETRSTRAGAFRLGNELGIGVFDSYAYYLPDTVENLGGSFIGTSEVHSSQPMAGAVGQAFIDWARWSYYANQTLGYTNLSPR